METTRAEMKLARQIADRELAVIKANAKFAKLTPAQKRVAVAKDVLKHLGEGTLVATKGDYLSVYDTGPTGEECHACALGAVFACATILDGGRKALTEDDSCLSSHTMVRELENAGIFSTEQLRTIECAFEGWGPDTSEEYGTEDTLAFNRGVTRPRTRMARIMRNIIANNGEFVP